VCICYIVDVACISDVFLKYVPRACVCVCDVTDQTSQPKRKRKRPSGIDWTSGSRSKKTKLASKPKLQKSKKQILLDLVCHCGAFTPSPYSITTVSTCTVLVIQTMDQGIKYARHFLVLLIVGLFSSHKKFRPQAHDVCGKKTTLLDALQTAVPSIKNSVINSLKDQKTRIGMCLHFAILYGV